ncbi:MAG: AAA family ATPase [Acidimicrobiales bacterium]
MEVAPLFGSGEARLVTLTGAGGIGKTRLAVAVAGQVSADYPDGVYFVDLSFETDPDRILVKVADAAGIPVGGSALESLADGPAHQRVLLVLDNFEQVVDGARPVADLLARAPWGACPGHQPGRAPGGWRARVLGGAARRAGGSGR